MAKNTAKNHRRNEKKKILKAILKEHCEIRSPPLTQSTAGMSKNQIRKLKNRLHFQFLSKSSSASIYNKSSPSGLNPPNPPPTCHKQQLQIKPEKVIMGYPEIQPSHPSSVHKKTLLEGANAIIRPLQEELREAKEEIKKLQEENKGLKSQYSIGTSPKEYIEDTKEGLKSQDSIETRPREYIEDTKDATITERSSNTNNIGKPAQKFRLRDIRELTNPGVIRTNTNIIDKSPPELNLIPRINPVQKF